MNALNQQARFLSIISESADIETRLVEHPGHGMYRYYHPGGLIIVTVIGSFSEVLRCFQVAANDLN